MEEHEPSHHGKIIFQHWVPGKILLSGEYAVLDGATAVGLASRLGQSIEVYRGKVPGTLQWTALDHLKSPWLEVNYNLHNGLWTIEQTISTLHAPNEQAERLRQWLQEAWNLMSAPTQTAGNSLNLWNTLLQEQGLEVQTRLDFPRHWGLGSSSSAIALIATWLGVDARRLYALTQNGSGYDLEVALQNSSILYELPQPLDGSRSSSGNGSGPSVQRINYRLPVGGQLWLVDTGGKQISSGEVIRYRNLDPNRRLACVSEISDLSKALAACGEVPVMMQDLARHDAIMEGLLGQTCLHRIAGQGFPGRLKSLGAWGGDLFLAVSDHPDEAVDWLQNQEGWRLHPFEQIILCEP